MTVGGPKRVLRAAGVKADIFVNERLSVVWLSLVTVAVAIGVSGAFRHWLPERISGRQTTLYSTMAEVGATIVGFSITGVAILAALPSDRPLVARLRQQGLLANAARDVSRAASATAVLTVASLLGIVLDPSPVAPIKQSSSLPLGAYWIWVVGAALLPALSLMTSSFYRVMSAVQLASREVDRLP